MQTDKKKTHTQTQHTHTQNKIHTFLPHYNIHYTLYVSVSPNYVKYIKIFGFKNKPEGKNTNS